eukprot:gnl/TRDRNA2_/TRDRNA2_166254_c0_seq5.p1 gnl/TRDRNA2_/TRDRNA2_166254_c0~~gnl/TRDRNA2_/TRDRNA2_166254_c0_seq5.p1  ORF type:complete len:212 (-),score=26.50 gnl/TRDRNA2_/TRDRNA2_166254_c0_seq5:232-834(-)
MAPVALRWALLVAGTLPMESVPMNLPNATNLSNSSCPLGEVHKYLVDNTLLKSDNPNGVNYRNTKNLLDRAPEDAQWWTIVQGIDSGDGWVSVVANGKYLPMTIRDEPVLLCNPTSEQLAAAEQSKSEADKGSWFDPLLAWVSGIEIGQIIASGMIMFFCCIGCCGRGGGYGGGHGGGDGGGDGGGYGGGGDGGGGGGGE